MPKTKTQKSKSTAKPRKSASQAPKSKSSKSKPRLHLNWSEHCLIGSIIVCALCIFVAIIIDIAVDPARDAKNALEKLADDFYIDYLYPTVLGKNLYNPAAELSKLVDKGLPIQKLRQLLYYSPTATATYSPALTNQYVNCDLNDTTIRYFPVEPYGPRDYTVTFQLSCKGPSANSQWISDHSITTNH